jgi:hypothetical protein
MYQFCQVIEEPETYEMTIDFHISWDGIAKKEYYILRCNCAKSKIKYRYGLKNYGFMWKESWEKENDADKFGICGHLFSALVKFETERLREDKEKRIIMEQNMLTNKEKIIENNLYSPFYREENERMLHNFVIINTKLPTIKYYTEPFIYQEYIYGRIIFKDNLLKNNNYNVVLINGKWHCNCKNENCGHIIQGKKIKEKKEILNNFLGSNTFWTKYELREEKRA